MRKVVSFRGYWTIAAVEAGVQLHRQAGVTITNVCRSAYGDWFIVGET